jgi:hypothetical protein
MMSFVTKIALWVFAIMGVAFFALIGYFALTFPSPN